MGDNCGWEIVRTFTISDGCNQVTKMQTLSGSDQTAPALTGTWPNNVTGQNHCMNQADVSVLANDNDIKALYTDCGTISVTHTDAPAMGDNCGWQIVRTFTISDGCNQVTKSQTLSGSDQTAPALTGTWPNNISGQNHCKADADLSVLATDNDIKALYSDCGTISVSHTDMTMGDNCGWQVVRNFTISDGCNQVTKSQTLSGSDQTAPALTGNWPNNINGQNHCKADADLSVLATDNDIKALYTDCGTISVSHQDMTMGDNCGWQVVRTFTISDGCNEVTKSQTLSGSDQTAPALTGTWPSDISGQNHCMNQADVSVLATDNEIKALYSDCGPITVSHQDMTVGFNCSWQVIRTFTISDGCNQVTKTQTLSGSDQTAPALTGTWPSNISGQNHCMDEADVSVLATDNAIKALYSDCGTITVSHQDMTIGNNCGWQVVRTFTISDGCNEVTKSQTLSGSDQTAPTFTAPAAKTVCRSADGSYDISPEATGTVTNATDNCTAEPTIDYDDATPVENANGTLTIVRTWIVTDACGRSTEHDQTITVNPYPTISATNATQIITYGGSITPIVISNTHSTVSVPTLPDGLNYNSSTQTISGKPSAAGTYTFTVSATSNMTPNCGTAVQDITIQVDKKALIITLDSTKVYDGTPFEVTASQLHYNGLVNGDVITTGTIVTDDYWVGTYTCTDGFFADMYAEFKAVQSGFGPASVTKNYDVTFIVTLRIDYRPLEITANTNEKVFDNTWLKDEGYSFTNGTSIATTDAADITVTGQQLYVGSSDNTVTAWQIMHSAEPRDVTACYTISTKKGTLTVNPITDGFECPATTTVSVAEGTSEVNVTTSHTGIPTLDPPVGGVYMTNNLDELNPMSVEVGTYTVTWKLYDAEGHYMTSCPQTVIVQYPTCDSVKGYHGHDYGAVRIGNQCWLTENLRWATGNHTAYDGDEVSNLDKFGYLYSWYTAVGVEENNVNADLTALERPAADGTTYIQGICPPGWAVPSREDVEILDNTAGNVSVLKEPSTLYWQPGYEGVGGTGFNARGSGMYNSSINRYEDLMINYYFWETDHTPGTNVITSPAIVYYCDHIIHITSLASDRKSIRCIKKQ